MKRLRRTYKSLNLQTIGCSSSANLGRTIPTHNQVAIRWVKLDYQVVCTAAWRTLSAKIGGWLGSTAVDIYIKIDPNQHWWLNEVEQPDVMGSIDLDLNFSPSTNLLPIRCLDLAVGEKAEITAAWLRFPSFMLEPLPQQYSRLDESTYRYESAGGQFVSKLKVNRSGFVIDYPGIWQAEVTSEY